MNSKDLQDLDILCNDESTKIQGAGQDDDHVIITLCISRDFSDILLRPIYSQTRPH